MQMRDGSEVGRLLPTLVLPPRNGRRRMPRPAGWSWQAHLKMIKDEGIVDAEARRKYLQMDMAQRIKAKEVELSKRQQEVGALEALKVLADAP